ncbi:MAG: DMT family transporter [Rhodocyclales bacterium]|nr:DMT family transporter [Rhodocyclales bacterium]
MTGPDRRSTFPDTPGAPLAARAGWLAIAATICIWTGFILVSRAGGKGVLTGWDVAALRFGVGALVALFFLSRVRLPPLRVIALFSLFGGIGYAVTVYSAFRMAPAAHAAVLKPGALPFETAVIAWLWLGQAPSRMQRIGLGLIFAGIVLTAADTFSHGAQLTGVQMTGDALFLCGSSAWATFTLLLRRYPMQPLAATVAITLGSAIIYLPVWWLFLPTTLGQAPAAEILVQALYQGVLVVFVAMLLYALAVRHLGAQTVALLMAVVPGLSALAAVPLLDEPLSALALAGLAAVTAGAVVGTRRSPEKN